MNKLMKIALPAVAIAALAGAPSLAQDGEEEMCIRLSAIKQTPVIDNQTILVEMKGNGGYKRIDLLNRCSGLKIEGGFGYSTSINQLCKQDGLTVLRAGTRCIIDKIVDITEEEADALLDKKYGRTAATD